MVLDAEDKLDEAKYFLALMQENVSDSKKFKYNLSAFLAAARSVTDILRTQLAQKPGFRRWHDSKKKELEKNRVSKLMMDKRIYNIHLRPINAKHHTKIETTEMIHVLDGALVVLTHENGTKEIISSEHEPQPKAPEPTEPKITEYWFFEECPEVDVLILCTEYLQILSNIVSESKSKFVA
ncbi:MAG: hypothetical protein A2Y59_01210 [Chloroflexi bacterium RBG_13_52_14]|nr:MAG: hypothetical protein A2Y59_01210 [Chloroflexi bacterium RBG_13_52_14]